VFERIIACLLSVVLPAHGLVVPHAHSDDPACSSGQPSIHVGVMACRHALPPRHLDESKQCVHTQRDHHSHQLRSSKTHHADRLALAQTDQRSLASASKESPEAEGSVIWMGVSRAFRGASSLEPPRPGSRPSLLAIRNPAPPLDRASIGSGRVKPFPGGSCPRYLTLGALRL
jgi:hypothetical protein